MMDENIRKALFCAVENEPLAQLFQMKLVELDIGHSKVEMVYDPSKMDNIYQRAHGGAIFALIDEAFETVAQTEGIISVALNVNITYVASPAPGALLVAEANEISKTKKTANYEIKISDSEGRLIATCQALAFRTGKPIPFID